MSGENVGPVREITGEDVLDKMRDRDRRTEKMIEELAMQGLGRTITKTVSVQVEAEDYTDEQVITKAFADKKSIPYTPKTQRKESEYLGIILPCDKENNEHVIILANGLSLLTKSPSEHSEYRQKTAPSDKPLETSHELQEIIHYVRNQGFFPGGYFSVSFQASSDQPEQQDLVLSRTETALKLAIEIKAERERVLHETANRIADLYEKLFYSPQQPQTPESPQQE